MKNNITLAVIYGNESLVIERFIEAFEPLADHMVFCRAIGNQEPDDTQGIIDRKCRALGIPHTLIEYHNGQDMPHVDNFGAARQMAWDAAAKTGSKWLAWADCDDILAPGSVEAIHKAQDTTDADIIICPYTVKDDGQLRQEVMRERIIRNNHCSFWRFPVHENMGFTRDVKYTLCQDARWVHSPHHEKSGSRDRNERILKHALNDTGRNLFYLHQEAFGANKTKEAQKYGTMALQCELEDAERYEILLQLAQCEPSYKAKQLAGEAFALMPDRREALALLVNYALLDGDNAKALQLCRIMCGIPRPFKSYWSLNHEWYGWKADQLLLQCLRLNGLDNEVAERQAEPTFTIVHATLGRPGKALGVREMWYSRASDPSKVQYVFGLHEGDTASMKILRGFEHTIAPEGCGCPTNYDIAAGAARGSIIIQAQDDCYPPPNWDKMLLEAIPDPSQPVFVAVSDGHRTDWLCVNSILTRAYMDIKAARDPGENGFYHRGYGGTHADTENSIRAQSDGQDGVCQLIDLKDKMCIFHDHPYFNPKVPWDATYERENNKDTVDSCEKLYWERNFDVHAKLEMEPTEI